MYVGKAGKPAQAARSKPLRSGKVLAEPVREFRLGHFACCEGKDCVDGPPRCKREALPVQCQKQAAKDPRRPLVTVNEGMIAGNAEGIGGGQCAPIILAIVPLIDRPCQRTFERTAITDTRRPAMFGKLAVVHGQRDFEREPLRLDPVGHAPAPDPSREREGSETWSRQRRVRSGVGMALLRQFAQNIAVLTHDLLGGFHCGSKVRIGGGQPHAIGRLGQKELVPRPHAQPRQHILGQDDPGRIADLRDFERLVHTGVIT